MLKPKVKFIFISKNLVSKLAFGISVLVFSYNALARDPYFIKYPQINEKVAEFTTAFVQNVLPEIKQSKIQFDFSNGTDGIKHTDMAYGQIQGTYSALAQLPDSRESATIVMDFRINLELLPKKENKPAEYAINFRADGTIDNTTNFMDFFMGTLSPECIEDNHVQDKSVLGDVCRVFVEKQIDKSKTSIDNAYDILTTWKAKFLDGLNKIDHKDIKPIKSEFISYIDQRIKISRDKEVVNVSIELANLANDFSSKALAFLRETKLIDYSIQSLNIQMDSNEILFSTHIVKLHVVSSINKYMELASSLTGIIESSENGAAIGMALREGNGLLGGVGLWDKASAGVAAGMIKIFGTENDQEKEKKSESDDVDAAEEDLGL